MKVKDLIKELSKQPEDMEVMAVTDSLDGSPYPFMISGLKVISIKELNDNSEFYPKIETPHEYKHCEVLRLLEDQEYPWLSS